MLKVDNICQSLNGFWLPVTLSGERQDTLSAGSTPRWVMATCFLALWLPLHSVWHSASWSAKLSPSDSVSSHLSHATKSWPLKSDVSWSFCTVPPLGPRNRVPDPPLWFLRANQNVCCCPCWRQTKDIQWKRPKQKGNQILVQLWTLWTLQYLECVQSAIDHAFALLEDDERWIGLTSVKLWIASDTTTSAKSCKITLCINHHKSS